VPEDFDGEKKKMTSAYWEWNDRASYRKMGGVEDLRQNDDAKRRVLRTGAQVSAGESNGKNRGRKHGLT